MAPFPTMPDEVGAVVTKAPPSSSEIPEAQVVDKGLAVGENFEAPALEEVASPVSSPSGSPPSDPDLTGPPELLFADLEGVEDVPEPTAEDSVSSSTEGTLKRKRSEEDNDADETNSVTDEPDEISTSSPVPPSKPKKRRQDDPETSYLRQLGFLPPEEEEEEEDIDPSQVDLDGSIDVADQKHDNDELDPSDDEEIEEMESYMPVVYDEESDSTVILKDFFKLHQTDEEDDGDEDMGLASLFKEDLEGEDEEDEDFEESFRRDGTGVGDELVHRKHRKKKKRSRVVETEGLESEPKVAEEEEEEEEEHSYDSDSDSGSNSDEDGSLYPPRKRLEEIENTLESAVELLEKCSNIVVLTGAGVSVSSGIPDFRSKGGVYDIIAKTYDLPRPECLFDLTYLRVNPRPFFEFAKELLPGKYQPSPTHRFFKLLEEKGKLRRLYTQNIDTLDYIVGISPEKIVTCHGSMAGATCIECKAKFTCDDIRKDIESQNIPLCPFCNKDEVEEEEGGQGQGERQKDRMEVEDKDGGEETGRKEEEEKVEDKVDKDKELGMEELPKYPKAFIKPDIVFFGESLPKRFEQCLMEDVEVCDMVIVVGSSLAVRPVCLLPSFFERKVPQMLVNRQLVAYPHEFDLVFLGDCDSMVKACCEKLKWDLPASTPASEFSFAVPLLPASLPSSPSSTFPSSSSSTSSSASISISSTSSLVVAEVKEKRTKDGGETLTTTTTVTVSSTTTE